jgi:glycosyltransferase involved in cell wall biosynthesis
MTAESSNKPALLYLSPVVPAATGGGVAMRAGMVLEALCEQYSVSLIVIRLHETLERDIPDFLRRLCRRITILHADAGALDQIRHAADVGGPFEVVHVFRLAAMEFVHPCLRQVRGRARLHLDLDDIESKTNRRIAELHRSAGDEAMAAHMLANAQRTSIMESVAFRLFDRIYVCSEDDGRELGLRCQAEIRVLKNVVRLPSVARPRAASGVFRFLFVGTLGYYPNQDGLRFFCTAVLPLIRAKAPVPFVLNVVGNGDSTSLQDLASGEVHLIGAVADLGPWYEGCDAVVVPVRAGGGTRIKILEAFSSMRPVVSTTLGLEGIEAKSGRHVLVADTPEQFAAACLKLMSDSVLAQALAASAAALVSESYTIEALRTAISKPR